MTTCITKEEIMAEPVGSHAQLCRGRSPCAVAHLDGQVRGSLRCFVTPLGLWIYAELTCDNPRDLPGGICQLRFADCSHFEERESRFLPTLYVRDGKAWGSVMTRRLSLDDCIRRTVCLSPSLVFHWS